MITEWINNIVEIWRTQLADNQIFYGVLASAVCTSALFLSRNLVKSLFRWGINNFTTSVTIYNSTPAYGVVLEWLYENKVFKKVRRIQVMGSDSKYDGSFGQERENNGWVYFPSDGVHFLRYGIRWFTLVKSTQESKDKDRPESIELRCLGRTGGTLRYILEKAEQKVVSDGKIKGMMWTNRYWQEKIDRYPRPLSSVILPDEQIDRIVADITEFRESKDWYVERGLTYKRGYMFSGPPGSGKTSLCFALCCHFNIPMYYLNLSAMTSDETLLDAFNAINKEEAIVIIEDIDTFAVTKAREDKTDADILSAGGEEGKAPAEGSPSITISMFGTSLSGLLNALDGITSKDGIIYIMTSNHPEKLDRALVRPGRVDVHEHFGLPEINERRRAFRQFYPQSPMELADEFAKLVEGKSMATLQGMFLTHKRTPEALVEELRSNSREWR